MASPVSPPTGLYFFFRDRPANVRQKTEEDLANVKKPHKDLVYMICRCSGFYALLFLIFQVLPLYYAGPGALSEAGIGLLLAFNGLFVFVVEMVLVYSIENRFRLHRIIVTGF